MAEPSARVLLGGAEHLDASNRVYANTRIVRFTEMEYAIPREHAAEALERVLALIERRRLPIGFPIEAARGGARRRPASTAYERPTAYIAVHQYRGMEFETYFRAVEAVMDEYGGARIGASATTRRPPLWPLAIPSGSASRTCGGGSTPRGASRTTTPVACLGRWPREGNALRDPGLARGAHGRADARGQGNRVRARGLAARLHRVRVRLKGFKGDRVPAVIFEGGRRAQGTRQLRACSTSWCPSRGSCRTIRGCSRPSAGPTRCAQWARRMVVLPG